MGAEQSRSAGGDRPAGADASQNFTIPSREALAAPVQAPQQVSSRAMTFVEGEHNMHDTLGDQETGAKVHFTPTGGVQVVVVPMINGVPVRAPQIGDNIRDVLGPREGLLVKQTMRGCCCNVHNEFSIHEFITDYSQYESAGPEVMFTNEKGILSL